MINILHLVNGEQYSGLERVIDHLADMAPEHGYRFHLVCLKPNEMIRRMNTSKARIHCVPMRSRIDLKVVEEIRRIALATNSRLIHSHTVRSALIARILVNTLSLPWMHHVHSPALYESQNKFLNYLNYRVEKWALAKADRLIPVSDALSEYLHAQYRIAPCKISAIYNGVPVVSNIDESGRDSEGPKSIGVVGLFRPRKGVEILLLACQTLLQQNVDFKLKLIGAFVSDTYRQNIERLVVQRGLSAHVEYTGFQENVSKSLAALDLFVLPSLYGEGLPMALLEAMAMRRVIVASSVDGIAETLGGGRYGYLVPPGDSSALAIAIKNIFANRDSSAKLASAAQQHQQANYSTHVMAQLLFGCYENCLQDS